jgi:hypothetical protein
MPEVIDCIAEGRPPSDEELFRVADHKDLLGSRAAFAWGRAPDGATLTLRAAQAALAGDGRDIAVRPSGLERP